MTDYLSNNPVGRLYQILSEIKRYPNAGGPLQQVLAHIFDLDEKNPEEVFYAYLELLKLLKRAREAIEQIPNIVPELYLRPFEHLEQILTINSLVQSAQSFKQRLTPDIMIALQFCAHRLSEVFKEQELSEEDLRLLREKVEALIEEILSLDLPREFQTFLVNQLDIMRRAIIYYRIHGTTGLKEALQSIIGAAIFWKPVSPTEFETEEKRRRWEKVSEKFISVIGEIAKLIGVEVTRTLILPNLLQLPPPT